MENKFYFSLQFSEIKDGEIKSLNVDNLGDVLIAIADLCRQNYYVSFCSFNDNNEKA